MLAQICTMNALGKKKKSRARGKKASPPATVNYVHRDRDRVTESQCARERKEAFFVTQTFKVAYNVPDVPIIVANLLARQRLTMKDERECVCLRTSNREKERAFVHLQ